MARAHGHRASQQSFPDFQTRGDLASRCGTSPRRAPRVHSHGGVLSEIGPPPLQWPGLASASLALPQGNYQGCSDAMPLNIAPEPATCSIEGSGPLGAGREQPTDACFNCAAKDDTAAPAIAEAAAAGCWGGMPLGPPLHGLRPRHTWPLMQGHGRPPALAGGLWPET